MAQEQKRTFTADDVAVFNTAYMAKISQIEESDSVMGLDKTDELATIAGLEAVFHRSPD